MSHKYIDGADDCGASTCVLTRDMSPMCRRVQVFVFYVLQCVAVCCSVLQSVAVYCSMLQCVVVRCSVLQCVCVLCGE